MTDVAERAAQDPAQDLEQLKGRIEGKLLTDSMPEYEQARMVADLTFNKRPLAIVKAASVEDVVETIGFARDTGTTLAVRSGGHSVAGHSTCDRGIVLDLSG
ncbi:MAG TPA: FAD-binding protein [Dehalococcoidia bacterium]|nr:FAD-binding protein [Dehalococcoidia bacterium]